MLFNTKVDEALTLVENDIANVPPGPAAFPSIHQTGENVQKGRELLKERQKLIRLADRSEHGWGMVEEYMADDLAADSEDEKGIERAEKAAKHRAGKRRNKHVAELTTGKLGPGQFPNVALSAVVLQPQHTGVARPTHKTLQLHSLFSHIAIQSCCNCATVYAVCRSRFFVCSFCKKYGFIVK